MFTSEVVDWLRGAEYLRMPGLPMLVVQHILYALVPLLIAIAIALPIGVWVGHTGRGGTLAINLANVGRAVPSLGIVLIALLALGIGLTPLYITLAAMAIPPIVTNSYVGVRQVDPEVRDAALGMGLSGWQIVRLVEMPIALPVIMAGIRTSAVQVVATATLAGYVALGGLGRPIFTGLATGVNFNPQARAIVIVGVLAVAVLSIATEQGLGWLERRVVPAGLQAREASAAGSPLEPAADPVDPRDEGAHDTDDPRRSPAQV